MKLSILTAVVCLITCTLIGCNKNDKSDTITNTNDAGGGKESTIELDNGSVYHEDGTLTLGQGVCANGFYDETNRIVNSGDIIYPTNGKIAGYIGFEQNIPQKNNYLLILMIDFEQQDFVVNGKNYKNYSFSLEGYDGVDIPIELKLDNNEAKEFTYLIVSEPEIKELSFEKEGGWAQLNQTKFTFSGRFLMNDNVYQESLLQLNQSYNTLDKNINIYCEVTKDLKGFTVLPMSKSRDDVKLAFGTEQDNEKCVIIAFLDWNQIPIIENQLSFIVELQEDKITYYDIILPQVETDSAYQVFMFKKPFDPAFIENPQPESSFRTIIRK